MPKIKQSSIDEIRAKIPIDQLIGDYVALKRSGSTLKGLSPFSHEKTPSFTVNQDKGFYYCFSTSQGGDMFDFVMKMENLNFAEAAEFIAKKYGVQLEYDYAGSDAASASLNKQLFDMHEEAAAWFAKQFFADNEQAKAVRDYWVNERKMTLDDARELRIGYAPVNSSELKNKIFAKKYSLEAIAKSSILTAREGERNPANFYPKFRGRLMIPICDIQGRVIAFTGRKTQFTPDNPAESGKYVNSRETEIFKKGNVAFNLHKAKNFIKEKDYCVIVEGQLDAIKMFTAGIKNTIATQGTAMTDNHMALIKRFCSRAVMIFDGDAAGVRANMKAISMCLKHQIEPFVVPLPEGDDPDSFIRTNGAEAMRELVENKKTTAVSFAARVLLNSTENLTAQAKGKIVFDIFEMLSNCESEIILNEYLREIAKTLDVSLASTIADYNNFISRKKRERQTRANAAQENSLKENAGKETYKKLSNATLDALEMALANPEIGALMAQAIDPEWIHAALPEGTVLIRVFAAYKEGIEIAPESLQSFFDSEKERNIIYKIWSKPKNLIENPVEYANDCIKTIYKNYIAKQIEAANREIAAAGDDAAAKLPLLSRIAQLSKKAKTPPSLLEEI